MFVVLKEIANFQTYWEFNDRCYLLFSVSYCYVFLFPVAPLELLLLMCIMLPLVYKMACVISKNNMKHVIKSTSSLKIYVYISNYQTKEKYEETISVT